MAYAATRSLQRAVRAHTPFAHLRPEAVDVQARLERVHDLRHHRVPITQLEGRLQIVVQLELERESVITGFDNPIVHVMQLVGFLCDEKRNQPNTRGQPSVSFR